jgi:hypothetical protein
MICLQTLISPHPKGTNKNILGVLALLISLFITGCATPPPEPEVETASSEPAAEPVPPPAPPRLLFAGFALHSQHKAFKNDVLSAEAFAKSIDPNALVIKLANSAKGEESDWPQATAENFQFVMAKMAEVARPEDKLLLLLSSRGRQGGLRINVANINHPPLTAASIAQALEPIKSTPTLVVLSACYSGSLIKALEAPNRVILTATDVRRTSLGCRYKLGNTYFGDALFNQPNALEGSIEQWMKQATAAIEGLEKKTRRTASKPQIYVGEEVRDWATQPLNTWFATPNQDAKNPL